MTYPDPYYGKHADADQKEERWQHPEIQIKIRIAGKSGISTDFQLARKKRLPDLAGSILLFESKWKPYGRPRKYRTIFERHLPEAIGLIKAGLHV